MATAFVGLGSNVGDPLKHLQSAVRVLQARSEGIVSYSSVYQTEPVGFKDQDWFLNAVVEVKVTERATAFHRMLKRAEREIGRRPTHRNGPREIDLDFLLYDDLIHDDPRLTLPHPRFHERAFVMVPLVEIAADWVHPILNRSMREIHAGLDDSASVRLAHPPQALLG